MGLVLPAAQSKMRRCATQPRRRRPEMREVLEVGVGLRVPSTYHEKTTQ
jgi:hypothetical protein